MTADQTIKCVVCKTRLPVDGQRTPALKQAAERRDRSRIAAPCAGGLRPRPDGCAGIVKWYSRGKGYGFITTVQGPDVFLHKSVLAKARSPCAGQLVEFALTQGPRGVQAGERGDPATSTETCSARAMLSSSSS